MTRLQRCRQTADDAGSRGGRARNKARESNQEGELRSQQRQQNWQEKLGRLWPFDTSAPDPAIGAESRDRQAQVRRILADMKPRQAKLLLLRHSGLSYQELAAALNLAPGSIGSLLTRAERAFAQKYRLAYPEEKE